MQRPQTTSDRFDRSRNSHQGSRSRAGSICRARSDVLLVALASACILFTGSGTTVAAEPRSTAASSTPAQGDWHFYNGNLAGERYSTLDQITPENVGHLRRSCVFQTDDKVSLQSGIVAVNGLLYFTAFSNTYAVDGATCKLKWKHAHVEPRSLNKVNRGLGYASGVLFRGTAGAHVLALDAATGKEIWDVPIGDPKLGESVPAAPIAWNGLVFIGNAGGDNFNVRGRIMALDAKNGHTVWSFDTVPLSGAERASWPKASPENPPSGGATWTSYALDEETGILFVSTGNPAPDFVEELRQGENLYTTSVLALDAKTGRLLAYVQPFKTDFHDWDLAASPALITTKSGRPLVVAAGKDGIVYGIERARLGDSVALARGSGAKPASLTVAYKREVSLRENADTRLVAGRPTRFCPGTAGGVEWNGPSHDPGLDLLFVNSIDWCTTVKLEPVEEIKGHEGKPWTGMKGLKTKFGVFDPVDKWKGGITALDAESGAVRWKVETPKPMVAGITGTAGGLVFTGDLDGRVLAYDAGTGKQLWQDATKKAIGGGVISYLAKGKQHVAAVCGLNSRIWPVKGGTAMLVVYSLK